MKKLNQTANKNIVLRVGYTSPGWPLRDFPNGIVTYVQNILVGLDVNIKPIIFAAPLIGHEVKDQLINVSKFKTSNNIFQKLLLSILYRIKLSFAKSILYRKTAAENARKIYLAIKELEDPLDILEIEESFGTASLLMKMTKVPIVTRLHGPWAVIGPILNMQDSWDFKLRVFREGEAIKNAQGVTAPSLDILDQVRKYYGFPLPHAQVIPNPVPEVDIDKQWQYDASAKPLILFVGRFDAVKGGDLLLEAFRYIALKHHEVELLFVGPDRGLDVEGKTLMFNDYIEQFIPESEIKKRIQFLGHCDSAVIAELRQKSLVTIVCSRYEVFSISLVEALAAGCPTVATAVGGMKDIIFNEYNGLHAEPESPVSIAEKVLSLIANPEKMQVLSKNAIEDSKRRFSPAVVAAQTTEYYKCVLSRQKLH